MQEKISMTPPPQPGPMGDKSPEVSQVLFTKVMNFLEMVADQERLELVLNLARSLQHEKIQKGLTFAPARLLSKTPVDALWKKVLKDFENTKALLPLLKQLAKNAQGKNPEAVQKNLQELTSLLMELEEPSVSESAKEILEESLEPVMDQQAGQETVGDNLIKGYSKSTLTSLKSGGASLEELEEFFINKLTKQAQASPPTPLSKAAGKLLDEAKQESPARLLQTLLKSGGKKGEDAALTKLLQKLIAEGSLPRSMSAAAKAFEEVSSSKQLYKTFAEKAREHHAAAALKEGAKDQIGNEISHLQWLINYLEKYDPNDPQLQHYMSLMTQISQDYPNLTDQDLQNLSTITAGLMQLEATLAQSGQMPQSAQIKFLKKMEHFLAEIVSSNQGALSSFKAMLAQLENELNSVDNVTNDIALIEKLLKELAQGDKLTPEELQQLTQAVGQVLGNYSNLSPTEQAEVTQLFQSLQKLDSKAAASFSALLSDALTEYWIQEYYNTQKPPTVSGLKNWIQQQLQSFGGSKNTLMQNIFNNISGFINESGFPQISGSLGESFGTVTGNSFTPNANYWDDTNDDWAFIDPNSVNQALAGIEPILAYFEQDYTSLSEQIEGIKIICANIKTLNSALLGGIQQINNQLIQAGSLPDDFANAILNHFMPGQEAYLEKLAAMLFYLNFGTGMDNDLLNNITGWGDANNNYGFSNWYNATHSATTGTSDAQTQSQITSEENQTNGDIGKAQNALSTIQHKIAEIDQLMSEGKLSPEQGAKLLKQLNSQKANITQAISNLNALLGALKQAYVDVGKGTGGYAGTLPQSDLDAIKQDENTVINGDPTNQGFGGLSTIYNNLTNEQQDWSNSSQQQQIILQMRMTQIQQEWTVVSTAIQLLNQMYMTPAQAIYK